MILENELLKIPYKMYIQNCGILYEYAHCLMVPQTYPTNACEHHKISLGIYAFMLKSYNSLQNNHTSMFTCLKSKF
jgi:hypothetical protein